MRVDVPLNPQPGDTYDYDGNTFTFTGTYWIDFTDGDTFSVSEVAPEIDPGYSAVFYWYNTVENTITKYNPITNTWDLVIDY